MHTKQLMRITAFLFSVLLSTVIITLHVQLTVGLAASHDEAKLEDEAALAAEVRRERRRLMEKPIIYTFFNTMSNGLQATGMSGDADDRLLQIWREEWSRVGWKPVILSMKTAKRHPDYEAINAMIDGPFVDFDRYCFLRWLAFAVVGGGFVADYDTLPLEFVTSNLPNKGNLTVHESSGNGGVPSFVSATADEYTRFAWSLARTVANHKTASHWSDMKAMQEIYQLSNGTAYVMENNVLSALAVLHGRGFDDRTCKLVDGRYAIHFSPFAIKSGKVKDGAEPQDRAIIGAEWLDGWRIVCTNSTARSTTATLRAASEHFESAGPSLEPIVSVTSSQEREAVLRPTIFTFFSPVTNKLQTTGMTDEADDQMLQTWREEWSRAGWNPIVLGMEHAKQYPDFETISNMLDGPFGEYDRYCFLRWTAFAAAGGGFVADYDTLPLNFVTATLPNGGKLTIHEQSKAGGVPSLVSATAEEYSRFTWSLVNTIANHANESHWSDMKAMQHIYQNSNGTAYFMEGNVMSAVNVMNGGDLDTATCELVNGKYGLHFSHHAIKAGKVPVGKDAKDRAIIGREWLSAWRKFCGNNPTTISDVKPDVISDNVQMKSSTASSITQDGTTPEGALAASVDPIAAERTEQGGAKILQMENTPVNTDVTSVGTASAAQTPAVHNLNDHVDTLHTEPLHVDPQATSVTEPTPIIESSSGQAETSVPNEEGQYKLNVLEEKETTLDSIEETKSVPLSSYETNHTEATPFESNVATESRIRPVIYTFVAHSDTKTLSQEDQAMITVWLMSWYEIGWEPRVLWLNSAEKHSAFNGLSTLLNGIASKVSPHFFLRWLAMANVGGGWLSDYDVMPLDKVPSSIHQLPNEGTITIHEANEKGGVPSLVSGSAEEYTRLCTEIVANALLHGNEPFWSESYALEELYQSGQGQKYFMQANVVWVESVSQGHGIEQGSCNRLEQIYAVHISSDFVSRSEIAPEGKASNARSWVLEWRRICVGEGKASTFQ